MKKSYFTPIRKLTFLPFYCLMVIFKYAPSASPTETHQYTLNTFIPDFQVNDNDGPNTAWKSLPAISVSASGNYIITWVDGRNGDNDIYAQIFQASGDPVGANFRVNDDEEWAYQNQPSVGTDISGNFIITWSDYRNGDADIYAQRYDHAGNTIDSNFKVDDDVNFTAQSLPDIAVGKDGDFIITWYDQRHDYGDIFAQRFDKSGKRLGSNIKINDDAQYMEQNYPAIAVDEFDNFIITWMDNRNGMRDIYAQRSNKDGEPVGSNFMVNDTTCYPFGSPGIACNSRGEFVILWGDERNFLSSIYAQCFSNTGTPIDSNFKITENWVNPNSVFAYSPSVVVNDSAECLLTWESGWDIYVQRFLINGSLLDSNIMIAESEEQVLHRSPSIGMCPSGNLIVTWSFLYDYTFWDITMQHFTSQAEPVNSIISVTDDTGSAMQFEPAVCVDGSGNFTIAWEDYRNKDRQDIYAQRFSASGNPIDSNFRVNGEASGTVYSTVPAIGADNPGNVVIAWQRYNNSPEHIYAQRFTHTGVALDTNFKVNDDEGWGNHWSPAIAVQGSGNFVIAWKDSRNDDGDIYAQYFDSTGKRLGTNFKINDDLEGGWQESPAIGISSSGNFIVTWKDFRGRGWNIYAQRFNRSRNPLGANFKVNDDEGTSRQSVPAIAVNASGMAVIVWPDQRDGHHYKLYAQRFSSDGLPEGSNFRVTDDDGNTTQFSPSISIDQTGNFIIAWYEYYAGDIFALRFDSEGAALGNLFRITSIDHKNQSQVDIKLWNDRIYATWIDNRVGGKGYDIWAKVLDWNNPVGSLNKAESQRLHEFTLKQNYPNPFNAHTWIDYYIPRTTQVEINIYSIQGQKITTLVRSIQPSGKHSSYWDASGYSSGVYIYQLITKDYITIHKMILIK